MATNIRRATLTDLNELIRWRMKSLREAFCWEKRCGLYTLIETSPIKFLPTCHIYESYLACFADQGYTAVGYGGLYFVRSHQHLTIRRDIAPT